MMHKSLEQLTVAELLTLIGRPSGTEPSLTTTVSPDSVATPVSGHRLIPVTEWNNHHSWPPPGGLRWLVFNEQLNGFDRVVLRVGRRVLIDEAAFFEWARSGAGKKLKDSDGDSSRGRGRPRGTGQKLSRVSRGSK